MPPRGLILRFTGQPEATRTTLASLTTQELQQRGWNIETLAGEHSGEENVFMQHLRRVYASGIHSDTIAFAAFQSTIPQTTEGSEELLVAVELRTPKYEEANENVRDSDRTPKHLNVTKIVLPPDIEPKQGVADILAKLEGLGLVAGSASQDSLYSEDDEATIRSRLEALGYL